MSALAGNPTRPVWTNSPAVQSLLLVALIALTIAFLPGIEELIQTWNSVEEYSYGWLIPPIVVFLVWQRTDMLRQLELRGSKWGWLVLGAAVVLCVTGRLSLVRLLLQYGFIVGIFGLALAATGLAGMRLLSWPLAMLVLMVPLPHFVLHSASEQLQLVSSGLGVAIIRLFQISVYLEGNIIDLGSYRLQVVDACSGLRYLFPLIAMACLAAYFYKAAIWKRMFIIASALPLTVIINSLRIGLIGFTVEHWGSSMADGLLHDFEGWVMFMVCLALLFAEMVILARVGSHRRPIREVFGFDLPVPRPASATIVMRPVSRSLQVAVVICVVTAAAAVLTPTHKEIEPQRAPFTSFPLTLPDGWVGRAGHIDEDLVTALELDDYLLVDYVNTVGQGVNFYIAYYASQTGAEKASHSPQTCIPGGGWKITDLKVIDIPLGDGRTQPANRALIERGEQHQVVYYWFKQRGRQVTGDWLVKWYIIRDSILTGRTDGALVRLVGRQRSGETAEDVDKRLQAFIRVVDPTVAAFVPN
jgi:exosortase D (VPLPA-CTERM-specific)